MEDIYDYEYFMKHRTYDLADTAQGLNSYRVGLTLKHAPSNCEHIIDWGCGGGGFLEAASKVFNKKDLIGVDVNPYSVFNIVSKNIKGFIPNMFDTFVYPDLGNFIMTFWDVFEHLQNPRGFLKKYAPGVIIISIPCLDGFYAAYGKNADIQLWKHHRPLEHLWSFTEESLRLYLDSCNYEVVAVEFGESEFRRDTILGNKNIMTFVAKKLGI
jgi:hypothetical protein